MVDAAAVILDGGASRRMSGVDKAWIEVGGRAIVERQFDILQQRFDAIAMSVGTRGSARNLPVHSLADRIGGQGPLDGIASALAWSQHDWLLVVAGDMPGVSLAVIDALVGARTQTADAVAMRVDGRVQPLFTFYHRRLLPMLDRRLQVGQLRVSALFEGSPMPIQVEWVAESECLDSDSCRRAFHNINSPADLATKSNKIE